MKQVQEDPSVIQREQQFLPRDPHALSLFKLRSSRATLVNNILFDGRSSEWAPALRGLLTLDPADAMPTPKSHKRKRGDRSREAQEEADEETMNPVAKSPRLDRDAGDLLAHQDETLMLADGSMMDLPADDTALTFRPPLSPQDGDGDAAGAAFDETMAPPVHPADSGPVSMSTTHAVHMLRDLFGVEAEHDSQKRSQSSVLFTDLLPEGRTTKADATRMFFECLVLATKDAVKVEQKKGAGLGAPFRMRAKRGLWGAWAEREAGGEMAAEEKQHQLAEDVDDMAMDNAGEGPSMGRTSIAV